ncbi:MAG: hypothetical protein ABI999_08660 [Acidobacteriota bacterium]
MKTITLAAIFFCFALSTFGQNRQIDSIDITSSWRGLAPAQDSQMSIVRKGTDYVSSGNKIDPAKLDNLLKALEEPAITKPSLENLGIDQAWLNDKAKICVDEGLNRYMEKVTAARKQLFISKYTDMKFVEEQIAGMFDSTHTDDYPRFEAVILLSDGGEIKLSSKGQSPFMIPWNIDDSSGAGTTYNTHISNALISLIPQKFTNADRLSGEALYHQLAEAVSRSIR